MSVLGEIKDMAKEGKNEILVIGAGLAGLTAARILQQAGKCVTVLEKSVVGGRVSSYWHEDFLLDKGYSVLFPAYPAVRRQLDLQRLGLVNLPSGAAVRLADQEWKVGAPLNDPRGFLSALTSPLFTGSDQLRLAALGARVMAVPAHVLLDGADQTTECFLRAWGMSERSIDLFFRPFFGGIFLDASLSTSARLFRYYFRMLLEGGAALPVGGIGQITAQLAEGLSIRHECVERLEPQNKQEYVRVVTDKCEYYAEQVVVATDPPELSRLTGVRIPWTSVGATYLSYTLPETGLKKVPGKRVILSPLSGMPIHNAHWLSQALPSRVPSGQALLVVTVLGTEHDAKNLDTAVKKQLESWYGAGLPWHLLELREIPYAQFKQPSGYAQHLLGHATQWSRVHIASEITAMSGIQGAIESGEKVAAILLGDEQGMSRPRGA